MSRTEATSSSWRRKASTQGSSICRRATLLLTVFNSLAGAAQSLALKWIVDGAERHRWDFTIAAAVVGGLASAVLIVAGRRIGNLADWMANLVGVELNRSTLMQAATMPGIEHLERPDYLDQASVVNRTGVELVRSAFSLLDLASLLVRLLIAMSILVTVQPVLVALPLFVVPSVVLVPRSQRYVERARSEAAAPTRASDSLHQLFFRPAAAMEMRIFGCADFLDRRADELWDEVGRTKLRGATRADAVARSCWWQRWRCRSAAMLH